LSEDKYPANLLSLHAAEESNTNLHRDAIRNQPDMMFAIGCVESSMNAIMHAIHFGTEQDDDERTVRILGIRLFNGMASALKLLLAGSEHTCGMVASGLGNCAAVAFKPSTTAPIMALVTTPPKEMTG